MRAMETKWLEDFVSLAETRSFSRSAQLRHVTQPAFSRRIQALEAWAGVDLVDRSAYPTRLTPAGQTLYVQALEVLQGLQSARAMLRARFGPLKSRLIALNVHDAAMQLVEGGCDLLIAYHHPSQPLQLDPARYDMVSLGHETLQPYVRALPDGAPAWALPGSVARPVPYLAYGSGAYLGRLTELLLKQAGAAIHLDRVYETDMAEGLKVMALEGHGVAFLPHSAVRRELDAGRLVNAAPPYLPGLSLQMELRAYRQRPAEAEGPHHAAQALWEFLGSAG